MRRSEPGREAAGAGQGARGNCLDPFGTTVLMTLGSEMQAEGPMTSPNVRVTMRDTPVVSEVKGQVRSQWEKGQSVKVNIVMRDGDGPMQS